MHGWPKTIGRQVWYKCADSCSHQVFLSHNHVPQLVIDTPWGHVEPITNKAVLSNLFDMTTYLPKPYWPLTWDLCRDPETNMMSCKIFRSKVQDIQEQGARYSGARCKIFRSNIHVPNNNITTVMYFHFLFYISFLKPTVHDIFCFSTNPGVSFQIFSKGVQDVMKNEGVKRCDTTFKRQRQATAYFHRMHNTRPLHSQLFLFSAWLNQATQLVTSGTMYYPH